MTDKMDGVVANGAPTAPAEAPKNPVPITTVYVNNLEEREKIDTIREVLTKIFEPYGEIVDINLKTSLKRKGQAFIVFKEEASAKEALGMDGFEMYGKRMNVQMARTQSDATVHRRAPEQFEEHKRKRLMLKDFKRAEEHAKAEANPTIAAAEKPRTAKTGAAAIPDEYVRPNKTLLLQNIPRDVDEEALTTIFDSFEGFKEVRLVSARYVAFAEFENEQFAITAKEATADTTIGAENRPMKVTYQRLADQKKRVQYPPEGDKAYEAIQAAALSTQPAGYIDSTTDLPKFYRDLRRNGRPGPHR